MSWAVTAATAVKASPTPPIAAAAAMQPVTGRPVAIRATASSAVATTFTPTTTSSAEVSSAYRPTTEEPSSSALPVSSFWRVWRTTAKVLSRATITAAVAYVSATTTAPISAPPIGPLKARATRLDADVTAYPRRAASSG